MLLAFRFCRIITPARALLLELEKVATRAMMVQLPLIC